MFYCLAYLFISAQVLEKEKEIVVICEIFENKVYCQRAEPHISLGLIIYVCGRQSFFISQWWTAIACYPNNICIPSWAGNIKLVQNAVYHIDQMLSCSCCFGVHLYVQWCVLWSLDFNHYVPISTTKVSQLS